MIPAALAALAPIATTAIIRFGPQAQRAALSLWQLLTSPSSQRIGGVLSSFGKVLQNGEIVFFQSETVAVCRATSTIAIRGNVKNVIEWVSKQPNGRLLLQDISEVQTGDAANKVIRALFGGEFPLRW